MIESMQWFHGNVDIWIVAYRLCDERINVVQNRQNHENSGPTLIFRFRDQFVARCHGLRQWLQIWNENHAFNVPIAAIGIGGNAMFMLQMANDTCAV